jgi:hypothetical protein
MTVTERDLAIEKELFAKGYEVKYTYESRYHQGKQIHGNIWCHRLYRGYEYVICLMQVNYYDACAEGLLYVLDLESRIERDKLREQLATGEKVKTTAGLQAITEAAIHTTVMSDEAKKKAAELVAGAEAVALFDYNQSTPTIYSDVPYLKPPAWIYDKLQVPDNSPLLEAAKAQGAIRDEIHRAAVFYYNQNNLPANIFANFDTGIPCSLPNKLTSPAEIAAKMETPEPRPINTNNSNASAADIQEPLEQLFREVTSRGYIIEVKINNNRNLYSTHVYRFTDGPNNSSSEQTPELELNRAINATEGLLYSVLRKEKKAELGKQLAEDAKDSIRDSVKVILPKPVDPTEAILAERGARYGEFIDHSDYAQDLKATMQKVRPLRWSILPNDMKQALEVIADKMARILNGDPFYLDNWDDIQGYARLISKRITANGERIQSEKETWKYTMENLPKPKESK